MRLSAPNDPSRKLVRDRSLPHTRPFYICAILFIFWLLTVAATISVIVISIALHTPNETRSIIGGIVLCGIVWFITFLKRRGTICPLCKGTPLLNSGALVNERATRIFPFNHGVSAMLSIIFSQRFRCMYCGSTFDLLKKNSNLRLPAMEQPKKRKARSFK